MGTKYKVKATGEVGIVTLRYPDGLRVLQFADGSKQTFRDDELLETHDDITPPATAANKKGRLGKGEMSGVTIDKMLAVYDFLAEQDAPVTRMQIQDAVGFNCVHHLMDETHIVEKTCLESMGLVYRIPVHLRKILWELADKSLDGIAEGRYMIEKLRSKQ